MADEKKIKDEELEKIAGAGNELDQVDLDPQPASSLDGVFKPRRKKHNELDPE